MSFLLSFINGYTGRVRLAPGGVGNGLGFFAGAIISGIFGGGQYWNNANNNATTNTTTNRTTNNGTYDWRALALQTNNSLHKQTLQDCINTLNNPRYY